MKFETDLSAVPSIVPLPTGTYIMNVVSLKEGMSSNNLPKGSYECKVLEPAEVAKTIPTWYLNLSFAPNALFRVKEFFSACGVLKPGAGLDSHDPIGKKFAVSLTYTEDPNYGAQNRIIKFVSLSQAKPGTKEPWNPQTWLSLSEAAAAGVGASASSGSGANAGSGIPSSIPGISAPSVAAPGLTPAPSAIPAPAPKP